MFIWLNRLMRALIVAAAAQVVIPLPGTPVPITGQTFGVLLVGAALGARRSVASLALYLALGLLGAPFFKSGGHGIEQFANTSADGALALAPTGGYLIGMLCAAGLVGRLADLGWDRSVVGTVGAMVIGNVVIYAFGVSWLAAMAWISRRNPISLLDNAPLAHMLKTRLDYEGIQRGIDNGDLAAFSITCSGYTSGQSVTFFQGAPGIEPWARARRIGISAKIGPEHLLASSALPFVFPAVHINREYFGDGERWRAIYDANLAKLGQGQPLKVGMELEIPAR